MHESPEAVSDFVSAFASVQDFFVYMQFQLFSATTSEAGMLKNVLTMAGYNNDELQSNVDSGSDPMNWGRPLHNIYVIRMLQGCRLQCRQKLTYTSHVP